ncbi:MAG: SRPBCC domain-containing protein [Defluviimonas denitrificans]
MCAVRAGRDRRSPYPDRPARLCFDRGRLDRGQAQLCLSHAPDSVWQLFRDPARVAPCIPGATVESLDAESFTGAVEIRFGPIRARFGGRGSYDNDDAARAGTIRGEGDDKQGKSKVRGRCAMPSRKVRPRR